MIDRNEFAQEMILRENIRKAIKIIKRRRQQTINESNKEEDVLRTFIRVIVNEAQTAVSTTAKHANTGINTLEDLLRNSNILTVLEGGFKSLTTNAIQRVSYRNHILVAVEKILAPEESRKEAGDEEVEELSEDIDIDVGDPSDDPDFIDVEEKDVVKSDGEVEKEEFALSGEDKTGRNKAFTDFQTIEKVILRAFDDLDDPDDRGMFGEYLIKNLALYFDKYEADLEGNVEEPAVAADATPGGPGTASADPAIAPGDEEEIANIELQEIVKHLNIDDIIENLL
jgi:hypothetical protein